MVEDMKENFQITICMEREFIFGLMEEDMKDIILMILNMDMVSINGVMGEDMKVNGNQENNMEKEFILLERLKEVDNGFKEKELNGMMKMND